VARRGGSPVETRGWRGIDGEILAEVRFANARYIGEASDTLDDGRRSAEALEPELVDGVIATRVWKRKKVLSFSGLAVDTPGYIRYASRRLVRMGSLIGG
jgi:hypothetical protein